MRGALPGGREAVLPSARTTFVGNGIPALNGLRLRRTPHLFSAPTVAAIETGTVMVDGVSTFFRRVPGEGPPVVFVHGNPTHSEDWQPFLDRLKGPGLSFDLPGWGRSARPSPSEFDYSMEGLGGFVRRFLQRLAVEDHALVVHDWGSVGLIPAQDDPDRITRLVIVNAVPLLPGYRWHRTARVWRTRGLGELSNRLWSRRFLDHGLRESRGDWSRHTPEFVDLIWDHLDRQTLAAVLRLYRSADPNRLAAAGDRLGSIHAPTLVVWGGRDRYLPPQFGPAYAARLPNSELYELPRAGHWPWIEAPEVVDRVIRFLASDEDSRRL
jgi:pimeloyl-ACP methyl ester carboxylesterase